jgi:integrase
MKAIVTQINPQHALQAIQPALLQEIGQIANAHASANVFADYRRLKADNTLLRQDDDLAAFSDFLAKVKVKRTAEQLATRPDAWQGVTWGVVKGFANYLLQLGYAATSLNPKLSTIKTYCRLAMQAGTIPAADYTQIKAVSGYSKLEGRRVDRERETVRIGTKKADARVLTPDEVEALIDQPPTPQGHRDRVLLLLMLDLGLRVGEVVPLTKSSVNMAIGTITFYREKVDKTQTHALTPRLSTAMYTYLPLVTTRSLIVGSRKGGQLSGKAMTRFSIFQRVRELGATVGIDDLGCHDLRHTWATNAAAAGTPIERLMDAGGWSNPITPQTRYIKPAKVANQGVLGV